MQKIQTSRFSGDFHVSTDQGKGHEEDAQRFGEPRFAQEALFDSSAVSRKHVTNLVDRTLGNSVQPGRTSNQLCEWFDLYGRADNMRKDWRSYRYHSVVKEYSKTPGKQMTIPPPPPPSPLKSRYGKMAPPHVTYTVDQRSLTRKDNRPTLLIRTEPTFHIFGYSITATRRRPFTAVTMDSIGSTRKRKVGHSDASKRGGTWSCSEH